MTKKARAKPAGPRAGPGPGTDLREQCLRELRGGADGVRSWNARAPEERQRAGDFRGVDLSGCALAGVDLGGLDLQGARFDGATLTEAWLLECDLAGASFQGANVERAWCPGAKLSGADFRDASLARANLRGCDCRGANFHGADLTGATLAGADLCGADLSATLRDATFPQARYDEQTRWPAGFLPREALQWAGHGTPPIDLLLFVKRLGGYVDAGRLGRALQMLKAERFHLYSQVEPDSLLGVVKSQTNPDLVYSCRLASDGSFACCSQDLSPCLGLRGALCKHLLVLVVGLARAGQVDPAAVERWVQASRQHDPDLDPDVMSETFLRYKAAEAGEVDWRPTETIPEDFYTV